MDLKSKKMITMLGGVISVIFSSAVAMAGSMDNMSGMSSNQTSMNHQKKMMRDKSMMAHHMDKKMSMKPGKGKMSSMTKKSHSSDDRGAMMQK
jgi:hypothetical protein